MDTDWDTAYMALTIQGGGQMNPYNIVQNKMSTGEMSQQDFE